MAYFSDYDLWKLNPAWVWEDDEREEEDEPEMLDLDEWEDLQARTGCPS